MKNIFRRHNMLKTLLLSVFVLCSVAQVKASHVAAADVYWDYVGTGPNDFTYRVTLILYRACEWTGTPPTNPNATIQVGVPITVCFTSGCYNQFNDTLSQLVPRDTLDQLCPNFTAQNACRTVSNQWPAFERVRYSKVITLPGPCKDWTVHYQLCCRNNNILNLNNPGGASMYVESSINNTGNYWGNSSPRFLINPIPYLCVNQPGIFLNGPIDPDNDSMITTNVEPLTGGNCGPGTTIGYNTAVNPYSLTNPVNSSTGYTVNPNTGTATFTPTLTGKFVIAFQCMEYDRVTGDTLGFIRRDVQLAVLPCAAPPPYIDSIPQNVGGGQWVSTPPSGGYILACPGVLLTFDIKAISQTTTNAVFLESNNLQVAPGSIFNVAGNGTAVATGTFSWTPTGADIGDYTIIFTAKDSTCNNNQPIVLKNYFVAFIKVLGGVDAGPDGRICPIEGTPWQFNVSGPNGAQYVWTALDGSAPLGLSNPNIPNPTAYPPYNFTYVVTAPNIISACKNKDTVSIYIDTSNAVVATPHDAVLCRPGYFQLNAQGIGLPPLQNMQCGTFDIATCTTEDTLEIRSQYTGGTVTPSNVYTPFPGFRTARMQFLLDKTDLYAYGIRSGTIRGIGFESTAPYVTSFDNVTISLKCTDRKDLSNVSGGVEPAMTVVYTATGPLTVAMGWNQITFDTPYSLDSTKSLIVEMCYNNATPDTAALVTAVNTFTQQMIVEYTDNGTAPICQGGMANINTAYYKARPSIRLNYCPAPSVPFTYKWTPGTFLSDSTIQNPLAYIPHDTKYSVTTVGRNGCKVVDTLNIHVPIHNYDVWPKDTTFCLGASFKMIASGDFTTVKWYEGPMYNTPTNITCDDCREPVATPKADTRYFAVMTDKDGCSDTMMVRVVVKPLPDVHIINNDTTLKYGQSIQLLVYGGYLYSWSPVSTLTNPNVVNPIATPTQPTTYYVYGLAENGCRSIDSVHISIDYRDNLFVPSAFTPNGDGKNDVFRVANMTFQRLQEFRVFNRWGQEIFSTTDAKKGWDGTWKGVPQDMGSYQYLIKVAYPDGFIETYKGNVSLIR